MSGAILPLSKRARSRELPGGYVLSTICVERVTMIRDVLRPRRSIGEGVAEIVVLSHIDRVMFGRSPEGLREHQGTNPILCSIVVDEIEED